MEIKRRDHRLTYLRKNILRVLYCHNGEMSITELVFQARSTYGEVMRCLRIYEGYAIVGVGRVDRRVYVSLNLENEDTKALLEVLWFLDSHEHRRFKHLLLNLSGLICLGARGK